MSSTKAIKTISQEQKELIMEMYKSGKYYLKEIAQATNITIYQLRELLEL